MALPKSLLKGGKQMKRAVYFFVAVLFVFGLIVSAGSSKATTSKPDILIGVVAPFSGPLAEMADSRRSTRGEEKIILV